MPVISHNDSCCSQCSSSFCIRSGTKSKDPWQNGNPHGGFVTSVKQTLVFMCKRGWEFVHERTCVGLYLMCVCPSAVFQWNVIKASQQTYPKKISPLVWLGYPWRVKTYSCAGRGIWPQLPSSSSRTLTEECSAPTQLWTYTASCQDCPPYQSWRRCKSGGETKTALREPSVSCFCVVLWKTKYKWVGCNC